VRPFTERLAKRAIRQIDTETRLTFPRRPVPEWRECGAA
jgi:hypothetical protein